MGLTRGNACAVSPGFSLLPDVRRPSDGQAPILPGAWRRTWCTPKGRHSLKHGSSRGDQTGSNDYKE